MVQYKYIDIDLSKSTQFARGRLFQKNWLPQVGGMYCIRQSRASCKCDVQYMRLSCRLEKM